MKEFQEKFVLSAFQIGLISELPYPLHFYPTRTLT